MDYNTKHNCFKKENEILGFSSYLVVFGNDIFISNSSNKNQLSSCNFGYSYEPPQGLEYGSEEAYKYLAGSYGFKTFDIEV